MLRVIVNDMQVNVTCEERYNQSMNEFMVYGDFETVGRDHVRELIHEAEQQRLAQDVRNSQGVGQLLARVRAFLSQR